MAKVRTAATSSADDEVLCFEASN